MAIGADLQTRYQTEVDVDWVDCIVISHPAITTQYFCNSPDAVTGWIDGASHDFTPLPFQIKLPARDNSGRQEMSLAISNVNFLAQVILEDAITQPESPIQVAYTIFIRGSATPQIDPPLALSMTDIVVTEAVVTATVTRTDILNLAFPREKYRPDWFPGLNRR